jgi:GTP1/Obg family GTP-binding protein
MSALQAFCQQLVNFFEELTQTVPEEKDIKMALEAIRGARKINPRLVLDLFYDHIYPLHEAIYRRDLEGIQQYARVKIASQFNEIMPALSIFDKHWVTLSPGSQDAIWKYLKVLCILCARARSGA